MIRTATLALLVAATCALPARAADYFANHQPVDNVVNPGRVQAMGDVEVVEFFWYGCLQCAGFALQGQRWANALPARVKYIRLPASWSAKMVPQQRLYFTLEALGRLDLHFQVFNDIHKKRIKLATPEHIEQWAVAQKIPANTWRTHYNSPAVGARVKFAQDTYQRFQLNWVPALVINGKRVIAYTPDMLQHAQEVVQSELRQK